MALLRLCLGWLGVTLWFLLFELIEQRVPAPAPAPEGRKLRASWKVYLADGLIFTLFAALWFASLGTGGWVLLFGLLGLLLEGPVRYRDGERRMDLSRRGFTRLSAGVLRSIVAGGILAWIF